MSNQQTICAVSTPPGIGAIAVIRLSGEQAIDICDTIFHSSQQHKQLSSQKANTIHYGKITENGEVIDEVMVSLFRSPHSYTGEDSAEISCHGSVHIQEKIMQLLIKHGARTAEPGEFTMRAFLNGKMDLSQAEAVADLIASTSEASRQVAMNQLRGGFSGEIKKLRKQLIDFISLVELELDFSEEDVEFADRSQLKKLVDKILSLIKKLLDSYELGNVIKNGIPVAIAGEPNVGKSTLLNILLNEDKAIVSEIAGTTRDVIEDVININGIQFRFIDTAGLRDTTDKIETLGIERTHSKIEQSAIVLILIDAANNPDAIKANIDKRKLKFTDKHKIIIVVNKTDTIPKEELEAKFIKNSFNIISEEEKLVFISAKQQQGIEKLVDALLETVHYSSLSRHETIVTNTRHFEALGHAFSALERAKEGLETGISGDFLSQDVRQALHYLGEITGEISTDEVLGNIFAKFCIGK